MSKPVKLSQDFVGDGWIVSKLEELLQGAQVLALRKAGDVQPLSTSLRSVKTAEGRRRLAGHLAGLPFPHYEPHPEKPGFFVRIDADRRRTVGRFVGRTFKAVR